MTDRIKIDRFEPIVCKKGIEFTVESSSIVMIKDHTTDKLIAMVNLDKDVNNNIEIAELVIEAIESWVNNENQH